MRLPYNIEERRRVIYDFDRDAEYTFKCFERYMEDVHFGLEHNLGDNFLRCSTLNLVLIMQQLINSINNYRNVIDLYLLDELYEKNYDLNARFKEAIMRLRGFIDKLNRTNVFQVETPDDKDVIHKFFTKEEPDIDSGETVILETEIFINRENVEKMNTAELLVGLDMQILVFESNLAAIKLSTIDKNGEFMRTCYELNTLLYAENYWPNHKTQFRAHIANQRLRGRVDIGGLERLRQETAHDFEYNTTSGKIWRDFSEDIPQMAIQMKEQKLDEEQWKYFFQRIFELDEFDRWIEELRNPPESEEDKQKRERLLKTNKVFCLQPAKSKKEVDILFLYQFIETRFITEKMFVYEWFALFYILRRVGVITTCTTEDFEKQMNDTEWFAHVQKKCAANEINTYGFLADKSPEVWNVKYKPKGNRASKNSIENIYRKYSELDDTIDEIYVKE